MKNKISSIVWFGFELCRCGCKQTPNLGRTWVYGHQSRGSNNPMYGKLPWNKNKPFLSGEKNPFYGMKHTPESKNKIKNTWEYEKHITDNFRKKRSIAVSGIKNPRYGKVPIHGTRYWYDSPLQGKISLRSSWELAYVKYLDSIKELWYYEIETFKLTGEMTYTPDFFLPRLEKFIEIKGIHRSNSEIKISKFKEEYPWDLEVLFGKDLKNLGVI